MSAGTENPGRLSPRPPPTALLSKLQLAVRLLYGLSGWLTLSDSTLLGFSILRVRLKQNKNKPKPSPQFLFLMEDFIQAYGKQTHTLQIVRKDSRPVPRSGLRSPT